MGYKPQIMFFYKNDSALDDILSEFAFKDPISQRRSMGQSELVYEHYILKCFKSQGGNLLSARGYKATKIIVERALYITLDDEVLNCCLLPMVCHHSVLGSRHIEVY